MNECVAVAITGQTGRVYGPKLEMTGEPLPLLADKVVKFLGLPITTRFDSEEIKSSLMSKLDNYLTQVHKAPLTRQQKLHIYKEALIPRLNWLLTIANLPPTWVERTLEPPARKYLKMWSGLPRCADPSQLYFSRLLGGPEMPSLPTIFKLQVTRYTGLLTSRDTCPICSSDSVQHCQTQLHVLNNCPTALKQGRYNVRHDKVLFIVLHQLQANVPPSFHVTADLDGTDYRISQY